MKFKSIAVAFSVALLSACSGGASGAPSEDQVKQALFDFYKSPGQEDALKKQLSQTSVKACKTSDNGYLCDIHLKTDNKTTEMFFVLDKGTDKWQLAKSTSYK